MAQSRHVRFDDGEEVSRAYLAEWVRQLIGGVAPDYDQLSASELTRLVQLFASNDEQAGAAA